MTTAANPVAISFQDAQGKYHVNAEARRTAVENHHIALLDKAQGDHAYRKALALAYTKYRNAGKGVAESEILAKSDAADKALNRDMADADAKAAEQHLKQLEGERASLRQLADWSREQS